MPTIGILGVASSLLVFSATANAQFTAAANSPYPVGMMPEYVSVGDFNGDGYPDLAIANAVDNTVTVLLGNAVGGVWALSSPVNLTLKTVRSFISWCYPAIHAAAATVGAPIAVGAAAVVGANASTETGFWTDWVANLAPTNCPGPTTCMDYFALDVYPNTWDASVYAAPGIYAYGAGGSFMCAATAAGSETPCYGLAGLAPCFPSTTDGHDDCQWFVPWNSNYQSGEVLASAWYSSGAGTLSGAGTCTYSIPNSGGAQVQLTVSGTPLAVTGTTVVNVGSGFATPPTYANMPTGVCSGSAITFTSALGPYLIGGALNLAYYLATLAYGAGEPARVNECNRPVYVLTNCGTSGSRGIFDNDYAEWAYDGMDPAWFGVFAAWASASGFTSVSPYATQVWAWYNPVNINSVVSCPGATLPPVYGNDECEDPFLVLRS